MKAKDFSNALGGVSDKYVDEAMNYTCDQKGKVLTMTNKKNIPLRWIAGIAAALVLLVGALGFTGYQNNYAVASTVSLDVNPSIELEVNRSEVVLAVNALNDDGAAVLGTMDLKGSKLDVAVNALIGSMLRGGYLSELSNSILISVDGKDADASAALQTRLTEEISGLLSTDSFQGAVLSQTVSHDAELDDLAATYGVTAGKAQLIRQIVRQDSRYTYDDLAALSINELNLLIDTGAMDLEQTASIGTASDKQYIGEAKAKQIALDHAGLSEDAISSYRWKLDRDDGVMVYDIEFISAHTEYDYEIDALAGTVLEHEKEVRDSDDDDTRKDLPAGTATEYIGETKAKEAALNHAGVTADQITDYDWELDTTHGTVVYEISFDVGSTEYDYDIDAATGQLVHWEKETDDDVPASATSTASTTAGYIGESAAREAALRHAGLTADGVTDLRVSLETDDGIAHYDVEFRCNGAEAEYEINAVTGEVIHQEWDRD